MAKVEVVTTVCDRCGGTEEVVPRQLRQVDRKRQATFDACGECRRTVPLEEWEKLIPTGSRSRTVSRRVLQTDAQRRAAGGKK